MMGGRGGRGGGPSVGTPVGRVTTNPGLNRFVWDVQNDAGVTVPPGQYQARLKIGSLTQTQPFNLLIDPNIASDGVTVADLRKQFEYTNLHRQLAADAAALESRLREAQARFKGATGAAADTARRLNPIATNFFDQVILGGTPGVDINMRYGKPGLRTHINYIGRMISGNDMKLGNDAIKRYAVLRKELDTMRTEVDRILGPARPR
jgi:hypothetical protein